MDTDPVGTATIEVLPDLSRFDQLVAAAARRGLTVTEVVSCSYDDRDRLVHQQTTTTVTAAVES